jgi:hypothetical protein
MTIQKTERFIGDRSRIGKIMTIQKTERFMGDGHRFEFQEKTIYSRKDGTTSFLEVWHSCCRKCGGTYEIRVPQAPAQSNSFGLRNCPQHRLTHAEVSALGLAAIRAAKEKRLAKITADLLLRRD